jgi:hypothetical protein
MRLEKIEKIRKLLSAAILECDTPRLSEAKRSAMRAISELDDAERSLARKKKLSPSQEHPKVRVADPLRAISEIDRMTDEENQKFSE